MEEHLFSQRGRLDILACLKARVPLEGESRKHRGIECCRTLVQDMQKLALGSLPTRERHSVRRRTWRDEGRTAGVSDSDEDAVKGEDRGSEAPPLAAGAIDVATEISNYGCDRSAINRNDLPDYTILLPHYSRNLPNFSTTFTDLCPALVEGLRRGTEIAEKRRRVIKERE